ncbi:unnamed protein product [Eretmochelys imbricata]
MTRFVEATEGADLLTEPLLYNPQLRVQVAESPSVRQRLVLAKVTRVGDLLDYDRGDWLDPLTLAQHMGLSRPRTPQHILQEVRAALPPTAWVYLDQVLHEGAPCSPSTPHQAPAPWTQPTSPPLHREPAPRAAASLLPDRAKETSIHARAQYPSRPQPCVPPRYKMAGPPATFGGCGAPVGQPIFHLGPEACWGYQLAAPSRSREHGHVLGAVHPYPRHLPLLRHEGNPGTHIWSVPGCSPYSSSSQMFYYSFGCTFPLTFLFIRSLSAAPQSHRISWP